MFLKKGLNEKVVEFVLFYLFCRLLEPNIDYIQDATVRIHLCKAPIYGEKSPYFDNMHEVKTPECKSKLSCEVEFLSECQLISPILRRNTNFLAGKLNKPGQTEYYFVQQHKAAESICFPFKSECYQRSNIWWQQVKNQFRSYSYVR